MVVHGELGPVLVEGSGRSLASARTAFVEPGLVGQIESWKRDVELADAWLVALGEADRSGLVVEVTLGGVLTRVSASRGAVKMWRVFRARTAAKIRAAQSI